jgi:hypothetical protein
VIRPSFAEKMAILLKVSEAHSQSFDFSKLRTDLQSNCCFLLRLCPLLFS